MPKSRDAFRTISEVAEWLDTQPHVLRFWESKFSQVRPVKRAGGRRYYRPADMTLLGGIKKLLHDDGMTIKGVQKLLREKGVKEISALSRPVDGDAAAEAAAIEVEIARDIPEAFEKPEVDPLEAQIAELKAQDEAAQVEEPNDAAPISEPATADTSEEPTTSGSKATPRNPLADVADSWQMREDLIAALMKTQDIDAENHSEIAGALEALQKIVAGGELAASS
ncbi:MAG: MerR family transcriptional regulator [Cognatishimia sp.]|uniref:MerR family transcriptional regulator n=1 Tax=Cognatishimia sp. TaxID=2211648 RepID=UPI004058A647